MGKSLWHHLRMIGLALAAVSLVSCGVADVLNSPPASGRANMTSALLVGEWHDTTSTSITMSFKSDGDFTFKNLPPYVLADESDWLPPGFDPSAKVIDGSGTWTITADWQDPKGPHQLVNITMTVIEGKPGGSVIIPMYARHDNKVYTLSLKDETYVKCGATC